MYGNGFHFTVHEELQTVKAESPLVLLCSESRLGAPSYPKQRSQTGTMTSAGTRHDCNYRGREQERVNSMSSTVHRSPILSHVCSTQLQTKCIGILTWQKSSARFYVNDVIRQLLSWLPATFFQLVGLIHISFQLGYLLHY